MKKQIAAGVGGVVLAVSAFVAGQQVQDTNTEPVQVNRVKVLTADGDTRDILVNPKTNKEVTGIVPAAPLMTDQWLNLDIKENKPMAWCLSAIASEPAAIMRDLLDKLYSRYGLTWTESCPSTYFVTDLAQIECGIGDGAVACATYTGQRGSKLSYNGDRYRNGSCRTGCIRSAMAHELGHFFMLDHTPCDLPVPSTMSPIYLPDGPACAAQGNPDFSWQDFELAEVFYGLSPGGNTVSVEVKLQRWIENSRESCPQPSGEWCIQTGKEVQGPTRNGPWYTIVRDQTGQLTYLTPFVEVYP